MSIIWSYKAPAHKKGGPSSLVTPQKHLLGVVRHLIKAFETLWIYYIFLFNSAEMTGRKKKKKTRHTWKTLRIHGRVAVTV